MPRKYPLADLLRVRRLREDAAAAEATARRAAVEAAQQHLEERRRAVAEFHQWRLQREEELWAGVMGRPVPRREIDNLKADIDELRQRERVLEDEVVAAEQRLHEARENHHRARSAHQSATKDRQKIDEHRESWIAEAQKRMEYTQELELEDFRVRDAEDWNDAEPDEA